MLSYQLITSALCSLCHGLQWGSAELDNVKWKETLFYSLMATLVVLFISGFFTFIVTSYTQQHSVSLFTGSFLLFVSVAFIYRGIIYPMIKGKTLLDLFSSESLIGFIAILLMTVITIAALGNMFFLVPRFLGGTYPVQAQLIFKDAEILDKLGLYHEDENETGIMCLILETNSGYIVYDVGQEIVVTVASNDLIGIKTKTDAPLVDCRPPRFRQDVTTAVNQPIPTSLPTP